MLGECGGLSEDVIIGEGEEEDIEGGRVKEGSTYFSGVEYELCHCSQTFCVCCWGVACRGLCAIYRSVLMVWCIVHERKEGCIHLSGYRVLRQCKVSFDNMRREAVFRQFEVSNEVMYKSSLVSERSSNA